MPIKTRRPSGKPGWGLTLITGQRKCGRTFQTLMASTSPMVARTFYIGYGERDPEAEAGVIEGADYELLDWSEYGGTWNRDGLRQMIRDVIAEPRDEDGRPNLLVVDGLGHVWSEIRADMDRIAVDRFMRKVAQRKANEEDIDKVSPTSDLWNTANDEWRNLIGLLRRHDGPVIVTTLLKEVTVMENGQPTKQSKWTVDAQKDLPGDATEVVEIPAPGKVYITGVTGGRIMPTAMGLHTDDNLYPGEFSMHDFWTRLGITAQSKTIAFHQGDPDAVDADEQRQQQGTQQPAQQQRQMGPDEVVAMIDRAGHAAGRDRSIDPLNIARAWVSDRRLLNTVHDTPNGRMSFADYIDGWANHLGLTPKADPAPAPETAQEVAADNYQEAALWLDELTGMAGDVVGTTVQDLLGVEDSVSEHDVPIEQVTETVLKLRPRIIEKLRENGQEEEADAYQAAITANPGPARWADLTRVPEPAGA